MVPSNNNLWTYATPRSRSILRDARPRVGMTRVEADNSQAISSFCPIAQAESPDISLVPAYLRSFAGVSLRRKQ
jgi:hypothetical protein